MYFRKLVLVVALAGGVMVAGCGPSADEGVDPNIKGPAPEVKTPEPGMTAPENRDGGKKGGASEGQG